MSTSIEKVETGSFLTIFTGLSVNFANSSPDGSVGAAIIGSANDSRQRLHPGRHLRLRATRLRQRPHHRPRDFAQRSGFRRRRHHRHVGLALLHRRIGFRAIIQPDLELSRRRFHRGIAVGQHLAFLVAMPSPPRSCRCRRHSRVPSSSA